MYSRAFNPLSSRWLSAPIGVLVSLPLLLLAWPSLLRAQFTEPTPDELKMTSDPKAPGAAAVYLYREEVTDDQNHFFSQYERIKVLTENGKELATVRIPYFHGLDTVNDIQGRTIHADGTVIPLTAKPSDLVDFKVKQFQMDTVVFTLPSVEVGSILEYRLKIRSPDNRVSEPTWNIQLPYFIHKAHFSFHPFAHGGVLNGQGQVLTRLMYSHRPSAETKVNYDERKDIYSIDLNDIPEVPREDWMPPLNSFKWRVEFYYTNAFSGPAFWEDAGKRWARDVDEFTSPTGELRSVVAGIVAPSDSDEQKAEKIYAAVMKIDNTEFSREKSDAELKKAKIKEIHKAEDVWKEQSGSANDIARLYIALARAAGLKVWPVQVVNRDRAIFDDSYFTTRQLNDFLAVVSIDGRDVFLDPGQKVCPFGRLHWKHSYASGLRLGDHGAAPVTTPAGTYKSAVSNRIADLAIDPDGKVSGTVRFVMNGPAAIQWRQLALRNDPDEVKKQFNDAIKSSIPEGVEANFDHFLALDDYTVNLIAIIKVSGNIGTATGKRFFLPGLFFESRARHPFAAEEKRITPIDVHYASLDQDEVIYHLPAGFTVESAPQATKNTWSDRALLTINSTSSADFIKVERTLASNFVLLGPNDYPDLHAFYLKVATADQQQLVLTRVPAAKGN